MEDTIQTINLLESFYENKLENKSILYTVDFTFKRFTLNIDQITIFKLNDLAEHFIKDIK